MNRINSSGLNRKPGFPVGLSIKTLFWVGLLQIFACTDKDPISPEETGAFSGSGVFVINEGLFGQDNASLSFYNRETGATSHDIFQTANDSLRLGDTANSMFVHEDRAFVVVNNSQTIEVFEMATAKSLGRIQFTGALPPSPRQTVVLNDTLAFVTALNSDEMIQYNPATFQEGARVKVGPAPEGLAYAGGRVFTANSGLGDFRKNEPGASTISVLDPGNLAVVASILSLRNPINMVVSPSQKIYVSCAGSYEEVVISGLLVIDPAAMAATDTIAIPNHPGKLALDGDDFAYVLTDNAIVKVDLQAGEIADENFVPLTALGTVGWFYSIAVDGGGGELFAGNARDFSTSGEVVSFSLASGQEKYRFETGINPGAIVVISN